jgi:EAL domain-containing protein (putative c-di-GMP-specific phosphodiesterase class I)
MRDITMARGDAADRQWQRLVSAGAGDAGGSRRRTAIAQAPDAGAAETWYQPRLDLKRKCLAGAEALACIHDPDRGLLMPADFNPGASESIVVASEQILLAALESWALFDQAGFNLTLAINVPVAVIRALPFGELVARHRPQAERWPGIILYLSEGEIVRDPVRARQITASLKVSGIRIAIDHFGAGYSSLADLTEIPFVELRLDHRFAQDCASDPAKAAICQTAIDLAHRFGGAASAYGIANHADLQTLMALGCDLAQGDLIAPPMSRDEFLALLREPVSKPPPPAAAPSASPKINRLA